MFGSSRLPMPSFLTPMVSLIMMPWQWIWSKLFPPPDFPLPAIPILGHLPYVLGMLVVAMRLDKAIGWMSRIAGHPVFRMKAGRLPVIFLNDVDSIKTTLESDCCNDRPYTTFSKIFFNDSITMSSGRRWKKLKPLSIRGLEEFGTARKELDQVLEEDVKKMLKLVAPHKYHKEAEDDPTSWQVVNFRHFLYATSVSATIWIVTRQRVDLASEEFGKVVQTIVEILGKGGNIAHVDLFPSYIMSFVPDWLSGMNSARKMRDIVHGFIYEIIKSEMSSRQPGKPRHVLDLFVDELLDPGMKEFDEATIRREILPSMADLLCSPESLGSSIAWCLHYFAAHPAEQKKMQEEIDALGLGPDEFPSYGEHRTRMPYTMAALHEAVRLGTAAPMGFPHYAVERDCKFKNFVIKQGNLVMANLFCAHRDPKYYPNPEEFKPTRFLESTEKGDRLRPAPEFLPFSTGQRRCPAENVSWHVIFKTMTAILKKFELSTSMEPRTVPRPNLMLPFIRAPCHMRVVAKARPPTGREHS